MLSWTASSSAGVVGYNVYWGPASRLYTNVLSTTNLTATVTNLQRGITYYFAATAFTSTGLESEFSNEVSYTPPARPISPVLRLSFLHGLKLNGEGEPYQTYQIQRTKNLAAWVTITQVTADRQGAWSASDPEPPRVAAFYRAAL